MSEAKIRIGSAPGSVPKSKNNPSGLTILSQNGINGIDLPRYFEYLINIATKLAKREQSSAAISSSLRERGSNITMMIGNRKEVVGVPAIGAPLRSVGFDYSGVRDGDQYPTYNDQPYFKAIERYLAGDHWQGGVAWRGPLPATVDNSEASIETAKLTMRLIEGAFISRNFHKECRDRHVSSVIGMLPTRTIAESLDSEQDNDTNNEEVSRVIDALELGVSSFWTYSSVHEHLQKATAEACAFEMSFIRWYEGPTFNFAALLPGGVGAANNPVYKTGLGKQIGDHLGKWRFHFVDPKVSRCAIYVDDADVPVAAYYERDIADQVYQEFQIVDSEGVVNLLCRTVNKTDDEEVPFELKRFNFQGKLLIHAMKRDTIFTPQFNQNVDAINVVYTVAGRSNIQASFVERVITNAQLDGYYADVNLPDGRVVKRFVPYPIPGGAGTTKVIQGVRTVDPDTQTVDSIATPGVYWKDPVSMEHFTASKDLFMENIYAEVGQSYVRINNSTAPSGYARETAAQDGSNFLQPTILMVNKALDWVDSITKTLLMQGVQSNVIKIKAELLERIAFVSVCSTIDKIPSTEDKRVARELFDAGIWTYERANYATGTANPAQDKRKLAQERSEGFGNNSFASRENATDIAKLNIASQQKIANMNQLRTQANSRSQATTGRGKGSNQANRVDGTPTGMKAGPSPKKPVSPNTSTPNAGRKPVQS